jgi:hypothetical protein
LVSAQRFARRSICVPRLGPSGLLPSCRRTTCASERERSNCLFECNGQSADPQDDRGLIIIVARFGISRGRKCDDADFARCQSFRRPTRTLCRFTSYRRIALQALSPAFGESLHEVDRFPCHEVFRIVGTATTPGSFGGCRSMTASLRSVCAQSRAIAIYFADTATGDPPHCKATGSRSHSGRSTGLRSAVIASRTVT